MTIDKKSLFFIIGVFLLIALLLILGGRAIQHEALSRQSESVKLAETRIKNIGFMVTTLLEQKATYLEATANLIQFTQDDIDHLLENEIDIKNIFVIEDHQLIYPDNNLINNQYEPWFQIAQLVAEDLSVLSNHYLNSELAKPRQGWYITHNNYGPVLIYWISDNKKTVGFEISYIKLLFDLIVNLDNQTLTDHFMISDNDQIIYKNKINDDEINSGYQLISSSFEYPLTNWSISYHYQEKSNLVFYFLSLTSLVLLIIFIIFIFIYIYREYLRTLRLAKQQVSFVGQVSHELKTPLTSITLYSEMLKERLIDEPEPITDYLDVITQESQRLSRLIQNILNFTKISSISIKRIHLNQLLNDRCQLFTPVLTKKAIVLNFIPCGDDDVIESDEDYIVQIVNNLLSNAEKYAYSGKQVDLSVTREQDAFFIAVRDYGNGIPAASLSTIFKPFYRLNSSLTEGVAGTGIGLTIAKQFAKELQGDITVKNSHPGALFTLILPIKMNDKE